jgi:hypothetical protein
VLEDTSDDRQKTNGKNFYGTSRANMILRVVCYLYCIALIVDTITTFIPLFLYLLDFCPTYNHTSIPSFSSHYCHETYIIDQEISPMDDRWLTEEDAPSGSEAGDFVRSPEKLKPKRKIPSTWRRFITFSATLGIAFGVTLYFLTIFGISSSKNTSFSDVYEESPCGNTPEEASSRGCKFEMQNLAWMPEECYDAQLAEEWNQMPWQFWLDHDLQKPVAKSEVVTGFVPHVYVTYLQHKHHCMFMWHK